MRGFFAFLEKVFYVLFCSRWNAGTLALAITTLFACSSSETPVTSQVKASTSSNSSALLVPVKHRLAQADQHMPRLEQVDFAVGRSFFRNPWVEAPSATDARDGLGPLFNAISCASCHVGSARGRTVDAGQALQHAVVRLSVPVNGSPGQAGFSPEPHYGGQLQNQAVNDVLPEGRAILYYSEVIRQLAGGERVTLRKPKLQLDQLGYGDMAINVQTSVRSAPVLTGLGLLEAVPEAQLLQWADAEDANGDGISGRANRVWDIKAQQYALGRFGWKAEQPSVRQQTAAAFHADLGISSEIIQRQNCTAIEVTCQQTGHGGAPEISDKILDRVTLYAANLAVPESHAEHTTQGQQLFETAGCQQCHRAQLKTGTSEYPWLSERTIYPYSDLLLHDLGEELSDHRAVFDASGREWRTAPLWGIGLAQKITPEAGFLHDGRARTVLEAILWHGGEAQQSRVAVEHMTAEQRSELLRFVESL